MRYVKYVAALVACLCIFVGVIGLSATQAAEEGDIQAAIEAANRAFMDAYGQGDAAGVAALYTEDGMLLPPQQGPVEGREPIRTFWAGAMESGPTAVILTTMEAERHGDTAYEVGNYVMTDENDKTMDTGKYIVIWKRVDGAWKLHRDIWNTSVAPSGA